MKNNYYNIFKEIEMYDAFEDGPWHNIDFLDTKYPKKVNLFYLKEIIIIGY